ncbi:phospholipid-transporting ATPase IF-like 2, partial [Homarus americanus]
KQQATTRTILVNRRQPEEMSESLVVPHYTHNKIKTAKLSINSPVSPLTSVLPLVLVICVTAVKQGYEDWLRHREDNKVNNSPSRVLLEGEVKEVRTRDIEVGDIVVVAADEQFPCDLLLLMSSDAEGKCSVTTANLDGETNLKTFLCPDESQYLTCVDDLWKMRAVIECQLPHANLYDFKGKMEVYRGSGLPTTASLNTDNLLPRGARLKNTSTVSMNNFLVFFLAVLLLQIIVCTVLKYLLYTGPIMEMQKFIGAMFIEWDDQLICGKTGERCKCNTSDLNEELGQVQYLFTDKTGTLTENCMNFRHCSVEGLKYVDVEEQLHYTSHRDTSKTFPIDHWPDNLDTFLETLALCHTVQVTPTSRSTTEAITTPQGIQLSDFRLQYQAASPDEKALVEACARYGVVFEGQVKDELRLSVRGHTKLFKRLQVLEFDSDRKCMSVVVREEASGRIWLLTKGAESSMGLRTLAVARRELTKEDYQEFAMQLSQAKQMVEGREAAVREVTERMEAELRLLGATGVEDLLQEGVQETLEALRAAGIKVWVLTGDKVETAVNIAYSCGHFKRFMTVLSLTSLHDLHQAESVLQMCWQETEGDSQYGLVVDGTSLHILLENLKEEFYSVPLPEEGVAAPCHFDYFYVRGNTLVQYSFYKNVAFITPQSVYDSLSLTMYNITFTSLPVIVYGLLDQNLPPSLLLNRPELYQRIAHNSAIDAFNNYGVYWTYYLMFKSWSLMLASVLLVVASLLPDLLHKIYLASKDVRVRAQQRRKRKTRAVSLKAYISHVNKAFDPTEGSGSLWEVTKREDSENGRVKELGQGSRELGQGSRELGQGSRELGQGSREIGQGSREIGQGSREIGQGIEIDREKEIYLNKIMCQDKETGHYSGPWTQTEPLTHHRAMVAVSEKVADSETFIGNKTIINDKNSLDNEAFLESETENGTTSCTGSWASGSTLI